MINYILMEQRKPLYLSPQVEAVELRTEGVICQSLAVLEMDIESPSVGTEDYTWNEPVIE